MPPAGCRWHACSHGALHQKGARVLIWDNLVSSCVAVCLVTLEVLN